jgi:Zn-dependent peptidase ImmA (M78 family)/DNA-binding XRE family transcriptional regulator
VKATPERVDFVRRRMGLNKNEFAEGLGVDRKTLQRIYAEQYEASDEVLAALVRLSGYPREFFFKSVPALPDPAGVSFRSLRSLTAGPREAALAAAGLAFELDDWVRARVELPVHDLPQLNQHLPREAAAALRSYWGIGVRPIGNMINVLESHGVRVFSLVEETRHLDAYACWRDDAPYVFLNTCKTGEHSRFDAAHELAHLVLHRHSGTSKRDAEVEANTFASEFLMPQADLLAEASRVQTFSDLIKAKRRWGVSAAALNYALNRVGVIRDWQYKTNCIEISRYGRTREPDPMPHETSQIWSKVMTAFWQRGMTLSRIAGELHVPEAELTKILFNIAGPARVPERAAPILSVVR